MMKQFDQKSENPMSDDDFEMSKRRSAQGRYAESRQGSMLKNGKDSEILQNMRQSYDNNLR